MVRSMKRERKRIAENEQHVSVSSFAGPRGLAFFGHRAKRWSLSTSTGDPEGMRGETTPGSLARSPSR
jgi:hypothetical protein